MTKFGLYVQQTEREKKTKQMAMTPKVCFHILSLNGIKKCLPEKFNFKSSLTMSANIQPPNDPR